MKYHTFTAIAQHVLLLLINFCVPVKKVVRMCRMCEVVKKKRLHMYKYVL